MTKVIKKGYLTEKQAAKLLGKSQKWLQNDRYTRQTMPFIKDDGRVLYKKNDVVNFKEMRPGILRYLPEELRAKPEPKAQSAQKDPVWGERNELTNRYDVYAQQAYEHIRGLEKRVVDLETAHLMLRKSFKSSELFRTVTVIIAAGYLVYKLATQY